MISRSDRRRRRAPRAPMNVFLVSTGASLLYTGLDRARRPPGAPRPDYVGPGRRLAAWSKGAGIDGTVRGYMERMRAEGLTEGDFALISPKLTNLDYLDQSAELSTLFKGPLSGATRQPPMPNLESDHFIFLASDSPDGVLAGLLNAVAMGCTPHYVSDPTKAALDATLDAGGGATARCIVVRVPDLNPAHAETFDNHAQHIGTIFAWANALAGSRRGRLVLHASGGFKAVVATYPQILTHLPDCGAELSAWCHWEYTRQAIALPLYLPARVPGWAGQLNRTLTAAFAGSLAPPDGGRWRGFLYTQEDGEPAVLTPLGIALRAAWPDPGEALPA